MPYEPRVLFVYLNQDDPKKSTMKKLERFGLASHVPVTGIKQAISLTPFSGSYILSSDASLMEHYGIAVIDGSWNLIDSISTLRLRNPRKLPLLVPVNPVNFGKPGKLSSVEALAAALYVTGFRASGEKLLSKFNWGGNFYIVNAEPLEAYSKCQTQKDVIYAEAQFF